MFSFAAEPAAEATEKLGAIWKLISTEGRCEKHKEWRDMCQTEDLTCAGWRLPGDLEVLM